MAKKDEKPRYRSGPSPKVQKEIDALKKSKKGALVRARDAEMALDYANGDSKQWDMAWAWAESVSTMTGAGMGGILQGVGDEYAPEWETAIDASLLVTSFVGGVAATGLGYATGMPRLGCMGVSYFTGIGAVATAAMARDLTERAFDAMDTPAAAAAPAPVAAAA